MDSDVLRPFNETGEVSFWLNVTSESEIPYSLFEERTLSRTTGGSAAFRLDDLLSLSSFLDLHSTSESIE